jgi:hypothetical protein
LPPAEWHIVRTIVLVRDGHKCAYCGSVKKLHVDHKIPVCRGGSNGFENLLTPARRATCQRDQSCWKTGRALFLSEIKKSALALVMGADSMAAAERTWMSE